MFEIREVSDFYGDKNQGGELSVFDFFYGFQYVDVGLQRCYDDCIALDKSEGVDTFIHRIVGLIIIDAI